MKPYGILMIEHRLIERMVKLLEKEISSITQKKKADPFFIDTAVDFFRIYGDKAHHGKEEDILFAQLDKKDLSPEHKSMMKKLIAEHVFMRQLTDNLVEAKEKYANGDEDALNDIERFLRALVDIYPKHILIEDKEFFIPAMTYFSEEEQNAMTDEFLEFDRKMLKDKYVKMVEGLESSK